MYGDDEAVDWGEGEEDVISLGLAPEDNIEEHELQNAAEASRAASPEQVVESTPEAKTFQGQVQGIGPKDVAAAVPGVLEPLPAGWEAVKARAGDVYYYHSDTGKSTWERPAAATSGNGTGSGAVASSEVGMTASSESSVKAPDAVETGMTQPSHTETSEAQAGPSSSTAHDSSASNAQQLNAAELGKRRRNDQDRQSAAPVPDATVTRRNSKSPDEQPQSENPIVLARLFCSSVLLRSEALARVVGLNSALVTPSACHFTDPLARSRPASVR